MRPIRLLEETTGATVRVRINDFELLIPAAWNLLVVDDETKIVDTIQITQCGSSNYKAFMMHPDESSYALSDIVLIDLLAREACVHVTIPRMHMILHPVGPINSDRRRKNPDLSYSILLSPQDIGKHFNGMTAIEVLL